MKKETMFNRCNKEMTAYQTDLQHDKNYMDIIGEKTPWLHLTTKTSTLTVGLCDESYYPKSGEYVRYIFANTDRQGILDGCLSGFEYYINQGNVLIFHYFDGKTIKQVHQEKAKAIMHSYHDTMKRKFRLPAIQ